jgi:hypothetical protein
VSGAQWSPERLRMWADRLERIRAVNSADEIPSFQEAADALRAFARLVSVLERVQPGALLRVESPQYWNPYGDPLWRAWITGTGKWGEGSDAVTALVMLADALDAGSGE